MDDDPHSWTGFRRALLGAIVLALVVAAGIVWAW